MAELDTPEMLRAIAELEKGNYNEAFALLVPLAEGGNPRAECNLASLYHTGLGVDPDGKRAVELYRTVAEKNIREARLSAIAYNNLATIYLSGLPGIEPDHEKSRECQARATALGFEM